MTHGDQEVFECPTTGTVVETLLREKKLKEEQ
jgi:hypothetical protein